MWEFSFIPAFWVSKNHLAGHILDQPPLKNEDGPIGLIIGPTRELCQQARGLPPAVL